MTLPPFKVRCSQLGQIMSDGKKGELLSVGAKTYVKKRAKSFVYGYTSSVCTKEMNKGLIVENDSIALLNEVDFASYAKNTERRENDWIVGTADALTDTKVIDFKSSWSLSTFPAFPSDGEERDYEWQLSGYMMLWNKDSAELCYCMVDTPDELIGYEDETLHRVSHIDPALRVTRLKYRRDGAAESKIIQKVGYCQNYFAEVVEEIYSSHR